MEAIQNFDRVEYLLDELQSCTPEEAKALIAANKKEITRYADRAREFGNSGKHTTHEIVR